MSQTNDTKDDTNVHKELTERQRVIYDYISSHFFNSSKNEPLDEPLNTTALSQHLNIALATIKRDLRILIDKGLIRRVGGRKNGRWVIEDRK